MFDEKRRASQGRVFFQISKVFEKRRRGREVPGGSHEDRMNERSTLWRKDAGVM